MKKFLYVAIFAIMPVNAVWAAWVTPTCCMWIDTVQSNPITGCAYSQNAIDCGSTKYYDCTSCDDGYTLGSATVTDPCYSPTTYTYGTCTKKEVVIPGGQISSCPDECPSTTEWTATTKFREAICDGTLLNRSCSYRCIQGYYMGTLGCVRCPSSGGIYGTTAAAGATSITECYLPSGTTFTDSTGSGTYTGSCYYTE